MTDPSRMCRQHLLGEHKELHMFLGSLKKGKNLKGYYDKKLLNPWMLGFRHSLIAIEMTKRGYNHKTPIRYSIKLISNLPFIKINEETNEIELKSRCSLCFK